MSHRRFAAIAAIVAAVAVAPHRAQAQGAAAPVEKPGTGAWANYDFVPGEQVLFFEDFATDRVGDFPRRLELVRGNWEIVECVPGAIATGRRFYRSLVQAPTEGRAPRTTGRRGGR
jgi:hypothetical protein